MRFRELDAAIATLRRMAAQPGLEAVRLAHLRKALNELKKVRRSGKLTRKRVVRVIELLAELLDEPLRQESDR